MVKKESHKKPIETQGFACEVEMNGSLLFSQCKKCWEYINSQWDKLGRKVIPVSEQDLPKGWQDASFDVSVSRRITIPVIVDKDGKWIIDFDKMMKRYQGKRL